MIRLMIRFVALTLSIAAFIMSIKTSKDFEKKERELRRMNDD